MIKNIKIISIILIVISLTILVFLGIRDEYDKVIQNKIIDNVFNLEIDNKEETLTKDYLGYIDIPKFNIKRLIKPGTSPDILDLGYVGMHDKSGNLNDTNLIILAGHNIKNVFSSLHNIEIGDSVNLSGLNFFRKFVVYDKFVVSEYDISYLNNRNNELLLITCDKKGYRLLVFLKEEI